MNARQKAKKYKRMYEALLNPPVKFKVENHKTDTILFERFYPPEFVYNNEFIQKCIVRDISEYLANHLDEYIEYFTEFCPHRNKYRFYGSIKVVCRKGE